MRVRVLEQTKVYWNYGVQELEKGLEVIGDFARHLVDNAPPGSVEVVEADPEPEEKEPAAVDGGTPGAREPGQAGDSEGDGGEGPDGDGSDAGDDGPPTEGTIDQLMAWVDGDKERAAQALEAEQAKDKPRSTVVKRLAALAGQSEE